MKKKIITRILKSKKESLIKIKDMELTSENLEVCERQKCNATNFLKELEEILYIIGFGSFERNNFKLRMLELFDNAVKTEDIVEVLYDGSFCKMCKIRSDGQNIYWAVYMMPNKDL